MTASVPKRVFPLETFLTSRAGPYMSQNSIFGQNPKIGCQEFNDLQTPKLSKKQLCDRTPQTAEHWHDFYEGRCAASAR
jgi:hypothetical protein